MLSAETSGVLHGTVQEESTVEQIISTVSLKKRRRERGQSLETIKAGSFRSSEFPTTLTFIYALYLLPPGSLKIHLGGCIHSDTSTTEEVRLLTGSRTLSFCRLAGEITGSLGTAEIFFLGPTSNSKLAPSDQG